MNLIKGIGPYFTFVQEQYQRKGAGSNLGPNFTFVQQLYQIEGTGPYFTFIQIASTYPTGREIFQQIQVREG